ncbi:c-type cytochrome [Haliangium ochraceum]|uniref:Cytochrome c domain-containing protein n=1 Tax=Haliangium ochraceum (strain DSM 14365 / JCM 11303 / SMP-2) TaxID=502025 RepID=D0LK40_HALO1|nr:hypothetical protein [Haliangium ochraceum]ACY13074.1 conserved hypothetical protein [Haliangium ochraceum DSM 14365]
MLRSLLLSFALMTSASFLVACGGDDGDGGSGAIDCDNTTEIAAGRQVVEDSCLGCHSSTLAEGSRGGAPVGINFDSDADVNDREDAIRDEAIFEAEMPPGNPLSDVEMDALEHYLTCQ